MLYASSNNVPLKLKSGFAIDVEMPYVEKRQWQLSKDMPYWYPYNALEGGPLTRYKNQCLYRYIWHAKFWWITPHLVSAILNPPIITYWIKQIRGLKFQEA